MLGEGIRLGEAVKARGDNIGEIAASEFAKSDAELAEFEGPERLAGERSRPTSGEFGSRSPFGRTIPLKREGSNEFRAFIYSGSAKSLVVCSLMALASNGNKPKEGSRES
jgi:hypothetical protein